MDRVTLSLREYETVALALTDQQAHELAAARAYVDVTLRADGRYDVRAKNNVGTVVLPSVSVLLRPKIAIPDLFFLLSYAARVRWAPEHFGYAPTDDLFASVVWFFDGEMERARVSGLARDYVDVQRTLTTVRGRIDIAEQLRRQQLRPFPLECRFQEYTEDIVLNRVLKRAHEVALAVPQLDRHVALRVLDRHRRLFGHVDSAASAEPGAPAIEFTRLTEHWQPAYWLAELLLSARSLRDESGAVIGQAFTVRMDRVFERFVESVVTEELERAGLLVEAQYPTPLTVAARVVGEDGTLPGVHMRPDLVVKRHGKVVTVADVKYKRTEDIGDFQQPDIYQLFAYCSSLGLRRGLLIYADAHPHTTQRVKLPAQTSHIDLDTIGIDLAKPWRDVLSGARTASATLAGIAEPDTDDAKSHLLAVS